MLHIIKIGVALISKRAILLVLIPLLFNCAKIGKCTDPASVETTTLQQTSDKLVRTLVKTGRIKRVLSFGDLMKKALWNDPSVIRESGLYIMYATANIGGKWGTVLPFRATSKDDISWTIGKTPILQLDKKGSFDEDSVETPSVVKFKNKYHMFYTGVVKGPIFQDLSIGHAVSEDGVIWRKASKKPLLEPTGNVMEDWNGFHVAEPGAVVFNDKIYLYFHASGRRDGGGSPGNQSFIGVVVSSDGYKFSKMQKILAQTWRYPTTAAEQYLGYSTPSAVVVNGRVHLFYDVIANEPSWQQVALHHAVSEDGINFKQDANPILQKQELSWTETELRSPSALFENGQFKLWFAGHDIDNLGQAGIGYMELKIKNQ